MTNFPQSLDDFTNPTGASYLSDPIVLHSAQHANANDAIESIQRVIGVTNSTDQTTLVHKITQLELANSSGGSSNGNDFPLGLGIANAGSSLFSSRQDHVHPAPAPSEIGAASLELVDTKADIVHIHAISQISGLQTALDSKQPTGTYASTSDITAAINVHNNALNPHPQYASITYVDAAISYSQVQPIMIACSDETTALTVGEKVKIFLPLNYNLTAVKASLSTPQTSGNYFTVDVKVSGISILNNNKIQFANNTNISPLITSVSLDTQLIRTELNEDESVIVEVLQIGDNTSAGLKVTLIGNYN